MLVPAPTLARPLDVGSFTDITPVEVTSLHWDETGDACVHFRYNITAAQAAAVVRRCTTGSPAEEALRAELDAALAAHRAYLAVALPTPVAQAAQTRLLTRTVVILARLTVNDFTGTG